MSNIHGGTVAFTRVNLLGIIWIWDSYSSRINYFTRTSGFKVSHSVSIEGSGLFQNWDMVVPIWNVRILCFSIEIEKTNVLLPLIAHISATGKQTTFNQNSLSSSGFILSREQVISRFHWSQTQKMSWKLTRVNATVSPCIFDN